MTRKEKEEIINEHFGKQIQELTRQADAYSYLLPKKAEICVQEIHELEKQRLATVQKITDIAVDE